MPNLTFKQQRFVSEYSKDYNATQAAIRAGYSPRSAYNQGSRLLKNDEIQQRLNELLYLSLETIAKLLKGPPSNTSLKASTLAINLWLNANGYELKKYI